ncbi:MAG: hypothetical protein JSS02_26240 [Planctomycetes bacterium]|nr:hypothetical protein [Planctomycetota bacterium]
MITGTVKDGRLDVSVPANWPDGTEVEIHPLESHFKVEADALVAAGIAETLAAMDRVQPLDMSEVEQAAWEAQRRAERERDKLQFAEHAEKLRGMWD